jgi:hypothetical protein
MQPGGVCDECKKNHGPLLRPSESDLGSRQLPVSLSITGIMPNTISTSVNGAPIKKLELAMLFMFGETHELNKDKIAAFLLLLYEVLRRFLVRTDPIHMDKHMTMCCVLEQLLLLEEEGHEPGVQLLLVQLQLLMTHVFNILNGGNFSGVVCGDTEEDPEFVTPPPWRYTGPKSFREYVIELLRLFKQ